LLAPTARPEHDEIQASAADLVPRSRDVLALAPK
jgi:hypothetical protein